ncbi:hypothetical protein DYB32_006428 [Aphanomyces invadans]|uniref:Uncharacterized protein n=1 Tax=Aphanomyces invadans TaxID=157072 RepID=A0A418ARW5_9STRA|nr:hypothetical protein DYB32_006428 [Aphanomyces invadans]
MRSVESMFRTIDEKLELILDAQDARFRMLDDKFDRFNRRMDALERHSTDNSPRGPSPVVEDEGSRSSYETQAEMRRRLGSMETSSSLRRLTTSPASDDSSMGNMQNMQETLRYIHERLASLETQTQALPDKITPAIHRRLDTLETQVKILPERVDSLLRQLQSRLMDHQPPSLHVMSLDPQRHHSSILARTEESLSVLHRTLETIETQSRSLPDRVALAVNGSGKFSNYANRGSYGPNNDEVMNFVHARLESVEKQVGCLPERLQRFLEDDILRQLHGHFLPLESQIQLLPERVHHALKEVVASDIGDVLDQAMTSVHDRLSVIEKQSGSGFDRLTGPLEEMLPSLRSQITDLPHQWTKSSTKLEAVVRDATQSLNRHVKELTAAAALKEANRDAAPNAQELLDSALQTRLKPLESHLEGLPNVLNVALEDNVSVVAMVVNDALAVVHRRLDQLDGLPEALRSTMVTAVPAPVAPATISALPLDVSGPAKQNPTPAKQPLTPKPTPVVPQQDIKPIILSEPTLLAPVNVAATTPTETIAPATRNPIAEPPHGPSPPGNPRKTVPQDLLGSTKGSSNCNNTSATPTLRLRPMRKASASTASISSINSMPEVVVVKPAATPAFVPRKRRVVASKPSLRSTQAPATAAVTPYFAWTDGSLHRAPEDWVFPITNCRSLWELWYIGDTVHGIGPYRTLTKDDIKHHYVLKTRGKAAAVVQKVIDTAVDHGIVSSADRIPNMSKDECLAVFEQAFAVLMGSSSTGNKDNQVLPHNACNNMFTKVYTMLVNQKRKRSDDDNGEG